MSNKQYTDLISTIGSRINKLLQYDIQHELIRSKELGIKSHFLDLLTEFEMIKRCVEKLRGYDLNVFSLERLTNLDNTLSAIVDTYTAIKDFDNTKHNPQHRQNLINAVYAHKNSIVNIASDIYKINDFLFGDTKGEIEAKEAIGEIQAINSEAKNILSSIADIKESIRSAAEQAGVEKHARVFAIEAEDYEKKSSNWQIALFASIGAIIILAIAALLVKYPSDPSIIIQFSITKVVVFSAAFYALSIINRNYKAYKHNAIVNKHRQNALTTFETFIEGASDEQTKNAVLLQTTQAIFNNQNTGYNSADADVDMSTKVIEIFKSTAQSNKPSQ